MPDGRAPLPPFERKAFLASELDRTRFGVTCGELITCWELEQNLSDLVKAAVHCWDTLPDIIERDCGVPVAAVVALEKEIDAFREEAYLVWAGEETAQFPEATPAEAEGLQGQVVAADTAAAGDAP
jgi:hypothetical protein